jgi:hypothetical protein
LPAARTDIIFSPPAETGDAVPPAAAEQYRKIAAQTSLGTAFLQQE